MLNQVEKNRILNSIQNQSIDAMLKKEIAANKWNLNQCSDVLEFLISEISQKLDTKRKKPTKTISKTIYCLYATYISILKHKGKVSIKEDSYNTLLGLKNLYENSVENVDNNDINLLDYLYELIEKKESLEIIKEKTEEEKENTIINNESSNEELEKLKKNLKDGKKKLKEANQKIKELKENLEKSHSEEEIDNYKNEIESLQGKIKELNETISNFSSKNQSLESVNGNLKKQITDITNSLTNKNKVLESELTISRDKASLYDKAVLQKEYEEELDNLVLTCISDDDVTISELLIGLKVTFPNITKYDILDSLKRLQTKYILTKDTIINNEFTYKLGKKRNNIFSVKNNVDSLDIIVIADMHIDSNIDLGIKNLNYIYDYAANNNIGFIINLGDIIDSRIYGIEPNLEKLRKYDELVSKTIEKLPKDNNIINILLGGNHDRSLLDLGIDVTDRISKDRLDYLNLGTDHAMLQFNDSIIGLHHPNRRFDGRLIEIDSINDAELLKNLNDYYKYRNLDKNNIFIDLLGHFHVSKLSIPNSYLTVPSLNRDHIQNGAYRMKLFFDSNGNIINSILIPLIVDNKVYETTSINYQRRK